MEETLVNRIQVILSAVLTLLLSCGAGYAQQLPDCSTVPLGSPCMSNGQVPSSSGVPQVTPSQAEIYKKLTAEQRKSVDEAMRQKNGSLTPEAIEALKTRPEFQGITSNDVLAGKEMIEKSDAKKQPQSTDKQETKSRDAIVEAERNRKQDDSASGKNIFERGRDIKKYQEISTDLKPFGYEFFQEAAVKVMTDRKDLPVPADYVVGPGDEVKILLWGRVNANYNLVVDRNGNITIPQVGPVGVAGLTFEQMSKHLIKQSEQFVGANIDVTMGALKSIQIFVLGDVKRPGAYTIGSFATITDALLMTGGPNGIGTMRNIQLRRKDRIVSTFDLYDLLLKGDKSKDSILQAGDVVFVPVSGPVVGIAGNVRRPAIYELKESRDLDTLLALSGGIIPTAYTQQIQIERIIKNEKQVVVDIDDKHLMNTKGLLLQDIDLVKIFNIVERERDVVFLNGNVKRPGKYEYKKGMRIRDMIKDHQDLMPETYLAYGLLKRQDPPSFEKRLVPFSLESVLTDKSADANFELRPLDEIFIFSKWFFRDKPSVTVKGEVRNPGKFDFNKNMTVKDAILMAGDVTKNAYLKKAEIYRIGDQRENLIIYFDPDKALNEDTQHNIVMQDEDTVVIHAISEYEYKKVVFVDGDVLNPGTYPFGDGARVRDLVFAAGNVLESAYLGEAEITSQIVEDDKTVRLEHRSINLKKALASDPANNVVLRPYDRLNVKKLQDWRKDTFVTLSGEVRYPGKYVVKKNERLSSLIERAGGYSDNAYLRGAVFTRARVKDLQQKALDEMVHRMERELLAEGATVTEASMEGVQARQIELQQRQKFIETLKKLPPSGRMTIHLAHLRLLKGSGYDIELEEGDSLVIPTRNRVVNVAGAVMFNGSFVHLDDLSHEDYIKMAGGFSQYADKKHIFVMKVDGSARQLPNAINWNPFQKRWELDGFGESRSGGIEAGDSIIVPEKLERTAWLREIKDITQILANVGLTASSIALLYKTLN